MEFAYRQSFVRRQNRSLSVNGKTWREPPAHETAVMSITYITLFCHNSEVSRTLNPSVSVIQGTVVTDVSAQPIDSIFKSQAVQKKQTTFYAV